MKQKKQETIFYTIFHFQSSLTSKQQQNILKSGIANAKDVNFIKEEVVLSLVFFFLHHYFHN